MASKSIKVKTMERTLESQIVDECLVLDNLKTFRLLAPAGSGKTYAIKEVLREFKSKSGSELIQNRKQIAVITFTNLASNEIIERVGVSPLYFISTIHAFIWEIIKDFPKDIKLIMKGHYEQKIQELNEKILSPRTRNKESYEFQVRNNTKKLTKLSSIQKFIYSPNGDNNQFNSLNHSDVLKIGAALLEIDGFTKILLSRFPILFIDECQDTNKALMNAFLKLANSNRKVFCLGLFGDSMQRIYLDGLENINTAEVEMEYDKTMNYRSGNRIVQLINKIRDNVDGISQNSVSTETYGFVRAFIASDITNRTNFENKVRLRMDELLGVDIWVKGTDLKILTLEHMMAAQRFNFESFFTEIKANESVMTQIQDNRSKELNFLIEKLFLMHSLCLEDKQLQLKRVVLSINEFTVSDTSQLKQLKILKLGLDSFCQNFQNTSSGIEILRNAKKSFPNITLPDIFKFLVELSDDDFDNYIIDTNIDEEEAKSFQSKSIIWRNALKTPIVEAKRCYDYMRQDSIYATHQGVKGAGYNNVLAVFDDDGANGNLFSYEKLLGVKDLSETDTKNISEEKDNSLARTNRLFYVVCSRAIENLALVIYSNNRYIAKDTLIKQFGFEESEIELEN